MSELCSFRYHVGQPGIFKPRHYITLLPELDDEFTSWLEKYFGSFRRFPETGNYWSERWHTETTYISVRSNRGAGNRGGWERKPKYTTFVFNYDADAILFKMQWGATALPE